MASKIVAPAALAWLGLALTACTPTPQPDGGGVNANCAFAADQTSQDLRMTCRVSGAPGNRRINPVSGGGGCAYDSVSLFDQAVAANVTAIYGENGDDSAARVRIGTIVAAGGSHTGKVAKSAGNNCDSTFGPVADIATSFGGRHVALIDKSRTPMCVFQSRYTESDFSQTFSLVLAVDPSVATRQATVDAIHRVLDLEAARAVNRLLAPNANLGGEFAARAGRCENDWTSFTGS